MREARPPLANPGVANQQCLGYKFECDLCDAGYVGYTSRRLHQLIEEHKRASSSIGQDFHVRRMSSPPRVAHMSDWKMTTQSWQVFAESGDWILLN